jgi:glycosyltransferase involved in cell wall biosynthesis
MISRGLTARGFRVSFVTLDHGQPDRIEHDGIRVYKTYSRDQGWPMVRFFHPRWTSLWAAMGRANADCYLQRNAGAETGQVAMWCRRNRRSFVFAAASVTDCDAQLPYLKSRRERALYRYGLRHATRVVAQTNVQMEQFKRSFDIDPALIRSCSEDPGEPSALGQPQSVGRPRFLWVGRFAAEKRGDMLLDLAEACPEYEFDVVGAANAAAACGGALEARADQIPNVTMHGRVPRAEMGRYYEKATLLLCTSAFEGYPIMFMEAWARGIPTVSTVDPDDVITTGSLGCVADSVPALKQVIDRLIGSKDRWRACAVNARRFYLNNHTIDSTVNAYERLLVGLSNPRRQENVSPKVAYSREA